MIVPTFLGTFFGIEYLIAYAIIAAISIGVGLAMRRKTSQASMDVQSEQPSNQTARGGFIPIVMGRRRVGSVFLWTGDRTEVEEVVGQAPSGGKGGGGGGTQDIKQIAYLERGWIGLCCSKALIVHGIYKDGRLMENSRFISEYMPSGSRIDFGKDGAAYIFWGENHDLSNPGLALLNEKTKINSKWEGVVWMFWDRLRLGNVARWGNIEYDITTCAPSGIAGWTAPSTIGSGNDLGWNPALCILILLMDESPLGCAIPNCRVDFLSFSAVGTTLHAEGLAANILIQDGQVAENVIGGILEDIGGMLYEVDGKIGIRLIRTVANPVNIDDSVMLPPYDEIDRFHRITQTDQVVFTYANINRDFAPDIVNIEDDGSFDSGTRRRQRRVALTIATSETVAWKIANRRLQESFAPLSKYAIKFIRDFKSMLPGEVVRHPTLGDLRLIETRFDASSPTSEGIFVQDVYGKAAEYTDPDDGGEGGQIDPPLGDVIFRVFELPRTILQRGNYTDSLNVYAMMRVRKRNSVTRSTLYRGSNLLNLTAITSTTRRQFGGFLHKDIDDKSRYIESDVIIDIFGSAFDSLTDADKRKHGVDLAAWVPQTSIREAWGGGITVLIGSTGVEEICFAKSIEPYETATLDGKTGVVVKYRIRGLIRARHQTKALRKEAGVHVYAFRPATTNQSPLTFTSTEEAGILAYHRSRAANANGQQISLSSSPLSIITVNSKWTRAVPIQFVRFGEKVPNYNRLLRIFTPSYATGIAPYRPSRRLDTYAVDNSGVVIGAIACELTYPSKTYPVGAGGKSYSNSDGGGTSIPAGPRPRTADRFVLEVMFVPWDTDTQSRMPPVTIRSQVVADARSTDLPGQGENHASYIGTISIDYSATMHEQDRVKVGDYLAETGFQSNRLAGDLDLSNGIDPFNETERPLIGDRGEEAGNPPIFYIQIVHYMYDGTNDWVDTARRYYSYDSDLTYRFGKVLHTQAGWHTAEYSFTGTDGGEY